MKRNFLLPAILVSLFSLTFTSCTYIYDIQINSLEQSVVKIEDSNNTLTPEQLDAALQECGQKLTKVSVADRNYSPEQLKRIGELTERYETVVAKKNLSDAVIPDELEMPAEETEAPADETAEN